MGLLSLFNQKKVTTQLQPRKPISGPVVICVIGPPASGKETQAKLLAKSLKLDQANIGRLMANATNDNTPLGRKIARLVNNGSLISSSVMKPFLLNILEKYTKSGVVLDGFPRTVEQAQLLVHQANKIRRIVIVELELSEKEVFERVKRRLATRGFKPTIDEQWDVVDHKYLLYNTSKRPIQRALLDRMAFSQISYVKIDGNQSEAEVHKAVIRYVEKDLEGWLS